MANIIQALDFTLLLASVAALWFVLGSIRLGCLSLYDEKLLELRIRLLKMRRREEIDETMYRKALEKLTEMHPGEVVGNRAKMYAGVVWALQGFFLRRSSKDDVGVEGGTVERISEEVEVWPKDLKVLVDEGYMAKGLGFLIMAPIPTLLLFGWLASIFLRVYAKHRPLDVSRVWSVMSRILRECQIACVT